MAKHTKRKAPKHKTSVNMNYEEVMYGLCEKVNSYTGFANPRLRLIEGNSQILTDLIYVLHNKGVLNKKDMGLIVAPWPKL